MKILLNFKKNLNLEIKSNTIFSSDLNGILKHLEIRTLLVEEVLFVAIFIQNLGWQFFWINGSEFEENKIVIRGFNSSYNKEVFNFEVNLPNEFINEIKNKRQKLKSIDFKEKIKFLKKEYNPYTLADISTNRYIYYKDLKFEDYCSKSNPINLVKEIRKINCEVIHFNLTKAYEKYYYIVGEKITLLIGIEDFNLDNEVINPSIYQYNTILKAKRGLGTLKTTSGIKPFYGFALFIDIDKKYKNLIGKKINKFKLEIEKNN